MPEETDQSRNEDEHNSANRPYTDKFNNRISETKAAPRMPDPGESGSTAAALTRRPRIELSLTQILGSTGAAVTAAFLGSRLGVAGTLIGAALASVISVVGGAIYTNSIKATRRRVSQVIVAVRSQDDAVHGENEGAKHGAESLPHLVSALPLLPVGAAAPDLPPTTESPGIATARFRRPTVRTAAIGGLLAATVFAGALAVVTGYETVSGTAISGGQSGGLSILGGGRVSPGTPTRIPTTGATTTPTTSAPTTGQARTSGRTAPSTTTSSTLSTATTTATTTPTTTGGTSATTAVVPPPAGSDAGTSTAASTPASGSALGPSQNLLTAGSTTP